jgi:hypothetical protein
LLQSQRSTSLDISRGDSNIPVFRTGRGAPVAPVFSTTRKLWHHVEDVSIQHIMPGAQAH